MEVNRRVVITVNKGICIFPLPKLTLWYPPLCFTLTIYWGDTSVATPFELTLLKSAIGALSSLPTSFPSLSYTGISRHQVQKALCFQRNHDKSDRQYRNGQCPPGISEGNTDRLLECQPEEYALIFGMSFYYPAGKFRDNNKSPGDRAIFKRINFIHCGLSMMFKY